MRDLIVVTCYGDEWIEDCRESLRPFKDQYDFVFVDTNPQWTGKADHMIDGGWPTGALLWAYKTFGHSHDAFLLIQDSMFAVDDPLEWFKEEWERNFDDEWGCVAWQRFPLQWDRDEQRQAVEKRYTSRPSYGIFGPVFYTTHEVLTDLERMDLLPEIPRNRLESCASERAWAYAFEQAKIPVVGPGWDVAAMTSEEGFGPFRKTFANRNPL